MNKINNQGVNLVKHTAPYPLMLLEKTLKGVEVKGILDHFVGSGTTSAWCKDWGYSGVGVELDENYYHVSCKKVLKSQPYLF